MTRFSPAAVRAYYDANTDAFIRHGQGGGLGAIHRAVWAPGVSSREQAFRYVDDLIVQEIDAMDSRRAGAARALDRTRVVDLGCGIGGSLTYIAQQRNIVGTGVTVSSVQARIGHARAAALGVADRVTIIEGDYCHLPAAVEQADLAYAIESFVHGPSPDRFFAEAARILRPGGRLVVCDDVRVGPPEGGHHDGPPEGGRHDGPPEGGRHDGPPEGGHHDGRPEGGRHDGPRAGGHDENARGRRAAARTIARFERGWHINALLPPSAWRTHAARAGLIHIATRDLTPYLELGRPRDRLFDLLTAPIGWLPRIPARLAPLVGGAALQRGLSNGWIAYHCASFQRVDA